MGGRRVKQGVVGRKRRVGVDGEAVGPFEVEEWTDHLVNRAHEVSAEGLVTTLFGVRMVKERPCAFSYR